MALIKITAHPSDGSTALMFSGELTKAQLITINDLANTFAEWNEKAAQNV